MADSDDAILAGAREIRALLDDLVGEHAGEVRARLDELIAAAAHDPRAGIRVLELLRGYPSGNFVHQMQMTIRAGGQLPAPVEVESRGRPPESAANLDPRDISILLEPAPAGGFSCTALGSVGGQAVLPITATELAAVGEVVLDLRRNFLRGHGNPLGLIYAVHCDADTRIAPALARGLTGQKRLGRQNA